MEDSIDESQTIRQTRTRKLVMLIGVIAYPSLLCLTFTLPSKHAVSPLFPAFSVPEIETNLENDATEFRKSEVPFLSSVPLSISYPLVATPKVREKASASETAGESENDLIIKQFVGDFEEDDSAHHTVFLHQQAEDHYTEFSQTVTDQEDARGTEQQVAETLTTNEGQKLLQNDTANSNHSEGATDPSGRNMQRSQLTSANHRKLISRMLSNDFQHHSHKHT